MSAMHPHTPFNLINVLLILTTAGSTLGRHDGKSHNHRQNGIERRQANGPVGGISVIPIQNPESAQSLSATPNSAFTSIAKLVVIPSTSNLSYPFPSTVIQIPIATVCPDTPPTSAIFSIVPISSFIPLHGINSTTLGVASATDYPPTRIHVNATAMLPNGSSTVFLKYTTTTTTPTMARAGTIPTARILLDDNGCQTLFSPTTTAICDTTLYLAGMPALSVTDCEQWVTFSSEMARSCVEATQVAGQANGVSVAPGQISPTVPVPTPFAGGDLETVPGAFYAAPWYHLTHSPNLAGGGNDGIPSLVRIEDCVVHPAPSCATSSEAWSVTSVTRTRVQTSVASFVDHAILTLTSPDRTLTTALSFQTTITSMNTYITPSVVRRRLDSSSSGKEEGETTVVTVAMATTRVIALDEVTSVSTETVTERKTVTRLGAVVTRTRVSKEGTG